MTVKPKILGSLSQEDEDIEAHKAGKGQVFWSKDPTGGNAEIQNEFNELPQREQNHATWLQNALTDVELYFSKIIISDDILTKGLSLYNEDRDEFM